MEKLAPEWLHLQALSGSSAVFQSLAHIRVWARHFLRADCQPLFVLIQQNGRPVLLLPLVISGPRHFRLACIAGDPISQYSELLADPDAELNAGFEQALEEVRSAGVAAIVLRRVRSNSQLFALLASRCRSPVNASVAPYADLSIFPTYQLYLNSLSKNMRKGLRNRRHHLQGAGDVRLDVLQGCRARQALAEAIALKRRWLIQRGEVSTAFLDPAVLLNWRATLMPELSSCDW